MLYNNITTHSQRIKHTLLLLVICFAQITFAQTDEERAQMARTILDQMAAKHKSYSTMTVDFSFTTDNRQSNTTDKQNGKIVVKGDKYVLDLFGQTTYFDGSVAASWLREVNEVNISQLEENDESTLTPAKLFGAYEKGYKLRYMGEKNIASVLCTEVELYPTDLTGNIARIRLAIEKTSKNIRQLVQQGKDGIIFTVDIKKLVPNLPVDDSFFVFDEKAHPDVEVIDMR